MTNEELFNLTRSGSLSSNCRSRDFTALAMLTGCLLLDCNMQFFTAFERDGTKWIGRPRFHFKVVLKRDLTYFGLKLN